MTLMYFGIKIKSDRDSTHPAWVTNFAIDNNQWYFITDISACNLKLEHWNLKYCFQIYF